jgi:hypothetical protein
LIELTLIFPAFRTPLYLSEATGAAWKIRFQIHRVEQQIYRVIRSSSARKIPAMKVLILLHGARFAEGMHSLNRLKQQVSP